ncbi:MAG TPA: FHA domain-containing protein [Verrucomicrobiae bacterium]|nr:FHA domain-containing protein [Verrucomicrobiae bacterium]
MKKLVRNDDGEVREIDVPTTSYPSSRRHFLVGRNSQCHIRIPKTFDSISNRHLIIEILDDRHYRIVDQESANGTEFFDRQMRKWVSVTDPVRVRGDTPLRLGKKFKTSIDELLSKYRAESRGDARSDSESIIIRDDDGNVRRRSSRKKPPYTT